MQYLNLILFVEFENPPFLIRQTLHQKNLSKFNTRLLEIVLFHDYGTASKRSLRARQLIERRNIAFDGHFDCTGKAFEYRLDLVVLVLAFCLDVEVAFGSV